MADITDIRISFKTEEQAARAEQIARDMIRLNCALSSPTKPSWLADDARSMTLSRAYLAYGDLASAYDPLPEFPYSAVQRVHHEGSELFVDRCGDLVRDFLISSKRAFFPQICSALAQLYPRTPFEAFCRYELTITGGVTLTEMRYDGQLFRTKEMYVEWPKEEDDWSDADLSDYAIESDGTLRLI